MEKQKEKYSYSSGRRRSWKRKFVCNRSGCRRCISRCIGGILSSHNDQVSAGLGNVNAEHGLTNALGGEGYKWLGVAFFALMGIVLYRIAIRKE